LGLPFGHPNVLELSLGSSRDQDKAFFV
jgi:hypothetical protein